MRAILALQVVSKGRLLQETVGPQAWRMPGPAPRGGESEPPEELAGRSLGVPRLALPGVIRDSSVCRYGCGASGAQG